jgi:hypothetical protein
MIRFVVLRLADLVVVAAKAVVGRRAAVVEETRREGKHCRKSASIQDGAEIHVVAVAVMVLQNQRIKNTMQPRVRPR